jgi:hypothetical protein
VRLRLHPESRDEALLQQIQRALSAQDGVASVDTNTRTGSVLVHYDRHTISKDDLFAMLHDVGVAARGLLGAEEIPEDLGGDVGGDVAPHSSTATGVMDGLTDLDRRISEATGGKLDLKLLVPAGLGLLALRQVLTAGLGLAEVPGYVLLWYTFDSFYKLHQRKTAAVVEKAATEYMEGHPEAEVIVAQEKPTGA